MQTRCISVENGGSNRSITHSTSRGPLNTLQMLPSFVLCDWLPQSCLRLQTGLKLLALSFMCMQQVHVQYVQQCCPAPQSTGHVCCGHVQNWLSCGGKFTGSVFQGYLIFGYSEPMCIFKIFQDQYFRESLSIGKSRCMITLGQDILIVVSEFISIHCDQ